MSASKAPFPVRILAAVGWGIILGFVLIGEPELVLAAVLAFYVAIAVHELGHVVAAKLVGFDVVQVRINSGWWVGFHLGSALVVIGWLPTSGHTVWRSQRVTRGRYAWFAAGGVLAQCALIAVAYAVLGSSPVFWPVAIVNVYIILMNLVPRQATMRGVKYPTDGRQLLDIIRNRAWVAVNARLLDRMRTGDIEGALDLALGGRAHKLPPPQCDALEITIACLYGIKGDVANARDALARVHIDETNPLWPTYLNNSGSVNLLSDDPDDRRRGCDELQAVYELQPKDANNASSWADALLELNRPEESLALLDSIPAEASNFPYSRALRSLTRARALFALGRADDAAAELDAIGDWPYTAERVSALRAQLAAR